MQQSAADHQTQYESVSISVVAWTGQVEVFETSREVEGFGQRQKGFQGSSTPLAPCIEVQLLQALPNSATP